MKLLQSFAWFVLLISFCFITDSAQAYKRYEGVWTIDSSKSSIIFSSADDVERWRFIRFEGEYSAKKAEIVTEYPELKGVFNDSLELTIDSDSAITPNVNALSELHGIFDESDNPNIFFNTDSMRFEWHDDVPVSMLEGCLTWNGIASKINFECLGPIVKKHSFIIDKAELGSNIEWNCQSEIFNIEDYFGLSLEDFCKRNGMRVEDGSDMNSCNAVKISMSLETLPDYDLAERLTKILNEVN